MGLLVKPGHWDLTVFDQGDVDVLASGTYPEEEDPATFQLVRDGAQVYVVDPVGVVTVATQARVQTLTGPWASWGLIDSPGQTPVRIEALWAG